LRPASSSRGLGRQHAGRTGLSCVPLVPHTLCHTQWQRTSACVALTQGRACAHTRTPARPHAWAHLHEAHHATVVQPVQAGQGLDVLAQRVLRKRATPRLKRLHHRLRPAALVELAQVVHLRGRCCVARVWLQASHASNAPMQRRPRKAPSTHASRTRTASHTTCTRARTHACNNCARMHARTHVHTHINTHARTHTHTHACTRTHA